MRFALALALLAMPMQAWAEEPCAGEPCAGAASITWSAPPECPTASDLRAAIGDLALDPRAVSSLAVVANVTHDAAQTGAPYTLHLVLTSSDGVAHERALQGDTCREVFDAAAVVVAIAIHADVEAAPPVDPPPTSDAAPVEAAEARRPPAIAAPTAPPRVRVRQPPTSTAPVPDRGAPADERPDTMYQIGAIAGADFAALPAATPGFGVVGALDYKRNLVELRFLGFVPQTAPLATRPDVGGDLALYAASVRYCRSIFDGVLDVSPCAGIEAGAMTVSTVGLESPGNAVAPWVAPEIAVRGSLRPVHAFAVTLEIAGLVPIVRPHFVIDGGGEVFQPPEFTGRALGGLHVRFP